MAARTLTGICIGSALVLMVLGTVLMYHLDGDLPPPRPAPALLDDSEELDRVYALKQYRLRLGDDCRAAGIAVVDDTALEGGNPLSVEFEGEKVLKPGQELQTDQLTLKLEVRKLWLGEVGQGVQTAHMVLVITNKSSKPLAYYINTRVPKSCRKKGVLGHNALAVAPGKTAARTECLFKPVTSIMVRRVSVMGLSELGYHYVSRLDPMRMQFPRRTSAGHDLGGGRACKLLPWRVIERAVKKDRARWYDVIDFYSRHNCDHYSFHRKYRWNKDGPGALPVRRPGG